MCGLDSDGDGLTNGQELGDPECTWKPGNTPARSRRLSHPGLCFTATGWFVVPYREELDVGLG